MLALVCYGMQFSFGIGSELLLAISYCCKIFSCMSNLEEEDYLCLSMSHYQVSHIVLIGCSLVSK